MTLAILSQYEGTPGFGSYVRTYKRLAKEFARCGATIGKVELLGNRDPRSALRRFFTLEKADQADRWLSVEAVAAGRPIKVLAPFRRGLTLPYTLEIGLSSKVTYTGGLRRNMLVSARWELEPVTRESRELAAQLDALKLPSLNWRHDSGGIPIVIKEASRLVATRDLTWPSSWVLVSGYQGFVFNVGPRVAKYVAFAPRLEQFLSSWKPRPATAPSPKPTGRAEEPAKSLLEQAGCAAAEEEAPEDDKPLDLPDQAVIDALMVGDGEGGPKRR